MVKGLGGVAVGSWGGIYFAEDCFFAPLICMYDLIHYDLIIRESTNLTPRIKSMEHQISDPVTNTKRLEMDWEKSFSTGYVHIKRLDCFC